jgi:signal transduction histidine kinase
VKVSTKLWTGYGLLLVLLGSLLVYHVRIISDLAEAQRRVTAVSVRVSVNSAEQLYRFDRLWDAGQKFHALGQDSAYARLYRENVGEIDSALAALQTLSEGAPESRRVNDLLAEWREFRGTVAPPPIPPADILNAERDVLKQAAFDVSRAAQSSMRAEMDRASRDVQRARRSAWVVGGSALAAGLTIILLIIRSISRSLSQLSAATREVAQGRFGHRLSGHHDAEFRQLAENFNLMTRRLEEVDDLKRGFVSGISHDLKSPLASIKEAMRVLLDGIPGPLNERQHRLLRLGLASGDRLSTMIADLLTLSQLDSQAVGYRFEPCDLADLATLVAERLEARLEQAGMELRVDTPELLVVECDADRIAQVIENLLDNALKYSPGSGAIDLTVRATRDGERRGAEIRVADRGPGIPDGDKAVIFERFIQRGEPGGSAAGVGLGLTICREIVTAHEGHIGVEDNPDGGSLFVVNLPVDRSDSAAAVRADEPESARSGWAGQPT